MPSSNESLACRIDWRPSRVLIATLCLLTLLAMGSVWLSALPAGLALPVMAACLVHGIVLVRRQGKKPAGTVYLTSAFGEAILNFPGAAESWTQVRVSFRGPLASMSGQDGSGRTRRRLWWPDTLPAPARRQLRLVAGRLPERVSPLALPAGS